MIPYPLEAAGLFLLGWIGATAIFLPIALRIDSWLDRRKRRRA